MSTFRVRLTQGSGRSGQGALDTFSLVNGTVTGATNASPIVITTSAVHGLGSGTRVVISGVLGNTTANGTFTVTVLSTTTFSLNGSSGNGAYTSGGVFNELSSQRTMYAPGPNKESRKLIDGQTFTDCNYWKKFTYPTMAYSEAFIEVVSDDGSVWVDGETSTYPIVNTLTVVGGTTYTATANIFDILTLYGTYARFCQIQVSGHSVNCYLNGSTSAVLPIASGDTQIFNSGDLPISYLAFSNSTSGAATATVVVTVALASTCNS